MPRCASSSAPTLRSPPLDSVPNSSISMRSGVIVAALTRQNGPVLRADCGVDGARHHLLARAGRADDHDAAVGRRDACSMVWRSWFIAADMPIRSKLSPAALLEIGDLALQLGGFQRALGDQDQAVGLERLLDEIVGAAADRRDGGLDGAVARDHHHRQARMHDLDLVEQGQAVELASPAARCRGRPAAARGRRSPQARCRCRAPCGFRGPRRSECRRRARGCLPRRRR